MKQKMKSLKELIVINKNELIERKSFLLASLDDGDKLP